MNIPQNYETNYICSQIADVVGRRYNIRPDLPEDVEPDIKGYMIPEITAGLFRAWHLNELHFEILKIVNKKQVLSLWQISRLTGVDESSCRDVIEKSVVLGLLCENKVVFKNGTSIILYIVDSGGIFALSEADDAYVKLKFTTSIDKRINIYRKNIYLAENNSEIIQKKIYFLEDIIRKPAGDYSDSVILFDSSIAEKLNLKDQIYYELNKITGMNVEKYDLKDRIGY